APRPVPRRATGNSPRAPRVGTSEVENRLDRDGCDGVAFCRSVGGGCVRVPRHGLRRLWLGTAGGLPRLLRLSRLLRAPDLRLSQSRLLWRRRAHSSASILSTSAWLAWS